MKRLLLTFLCCASATVVSSAEEPAGVPALTPAPRPEPHMVERHKSFNVIAAKGEAKIVFLGDSITQGWEGGGRKIWDEVWAPLGAVNFGVSGDRTEHVLWRIDHGNFDGISPGLVVVMIGTNNTGHRMDPADQTAAGIAAILDRLNRKVPDAKILLLGIFPRGATAGDAQRVRNVEINQAIAKLADGKRVTFLDIGDEFLEKDGTLPKEIMPDLLHLNERGYRIWSDAIRGKVAELTGDKATKEAAGAK